MNVELRKLALYPRLSEETTAFNADLWIDGVKVGSAKNDGHGGMTTVSWTVPIDRRFEIETTLKARVPAEYKFAEGVEWAVDAIVEAKRTEKEVAQQDATFKRRCAKRGTAAARFEITATNGKEMIWVEYGKGDEAGAKTQMMQQHATLTNWTEIA